MKKSKFLTLYNSLNKKEVKDFKCFLNGLYQNQSNANLLFSYIKNHASENAENLEKDVVLKKLFQENNPTTQQRKNLDNTLSKLYGYLAEFLLWKKNKKKDFHKEMQLLDIYKSRQLDDLYFQKIDYLKKQVTKNDKKTIWNYLHLLQLDHSKFYHTNSNKISSTVNKTTLQYAMQSLDTFFFLTKLKLSSEMLNRQNILGEQYDILLLDEALAYFSTLKIECSTIYVLLVQFLKDGNNEFFQILKSELFNNTDQLPDDDQLIILTCLLNYQSSEMKKGKLNAYQEAFDLFQFGLQKKIFINKDGYISSTKFNNIVSVGCNINQLKWVESFIRDWQDYLDKNQKVNTVKIATAYLQFEFKEYDSTIALLQSVNFENIYYSLRARSLLLRCYYELYQKSNKEIILDHCKAFANFLYRNNAINPITTQSYFFLIKLVRMMLRKNANYEELFQAMNTTPYLFSKSWILEKINDFPKEHLGTLKE